MPLGLHRALRPGPLVLLALVVCAAGTLDVLSRPPAVASTSPQPSGALSEQGLDNLVAFARLYGYVRYFHPSDQAAGGDWLSRAVQGVERVESAQDAAELARRLQAYVQPLAPTAQVFHAGRPPARLTTPPKGGAFLTQWVHTGVKTSNVNPTIYGSERRRTPWTGTAVADFADPRSPFEASLGAGVLSRVPLAVFADAQHTLPAPASPEATTKPATGPLDRATRLAAVVVAWNVFQHFYPYFDAIPVDWPGALRVALRQAAIDPDEVAFNRTLRQMVAKARDGHGFVEGPGTKYGMPPIVTDDIEGQPTITAVGAQAGGLAPGDVIVSIDGVPAETKVAEAAAMAPASLPRTARMRGNQAALEGYRGTTVTLVVRSVSGQLKTVKLTRKSPFDNTELERVEAPLREVRPGILYADLHRLTQAEWDAALPRLAAARGLIFDYRAYPTKMKPFRALELMTAKPIASARWLVPIAQMPDQRHVRYDESRNHHRPAAPHLSAPKVFIQDASTVSAAETFMGMVEAYKLGAIVGETSAGTNGNINTETLPGGYSLMWTGMRVVKHDGRVHQGLGIQPTVPVVRTRAGVQAERDEYMERAIKVLEAGVTSGIL